MLHCKFNKCINLTPKQKIRFVNHQITLLRIQHKRNMISDKIYYCELEDLSATIDKLQKNTKDVLEDWCSK